ncbi:MAG: c-type cytochrome [Proteobacteria bacterium]|nr:c-type cytochrome [Burkholderiales bacterium]
MKKSFRIPTLALGALLVAALTGLAGLLLNSQRLLNRTVSVVAAPVPYTSGPAALVRGEYLFKSRDCAACHGAGGEGQLHIDDPIGLKVRSANLTRGAGSAVMNYNESDWVRAIRHGVNPDGRPLFVMPSENYNRLTDSDLADLVAYIRSLRPRDSAPAGFELPLVVRLLHGAGQIPDAAAKIDHNLPPQKPMAEADDVEVGRYVAQTCIACHGAQLKGGRIPGTPPSWPAAANLSGDAGGAMRRYPDVRAFSTLLRSGTRPDGSRVAPEMPANPHFSDKDLNALFVFLQSLHQP